MSAHAMPTVVHAADVLDGQSTQLVRGYSS
jgi:hypothetical protein